MDVWCCCCKRHHPQAALICFGSAKIESVEGRIWGTFSKWGRGLIGGGKGGKGPLACFPSLHTGCIQETGFKGHETLSFVWVPVKQHSEKATHATNSNMAM